MSEKASVAIMVRITPAMMSKVQGVAAAIGQKPATLARMGLVELVNRLAAQAPELSPEISQVVAAAAARGIDVRQTLVTALEAKLAQDASQPPAAA